MMVPLPARQSLRGNYLFLVAVFCRPFSLLLTAIAWVALNGCFLANRLHSQEVDPAEADEEITRQIVRVAPPHILHLIDVGSVRFVRDDAQLRKANRVALTHFRFEIRNRVQFRVQPLGSNGAHQVRIALSLQEPKLKLHHIVVLPSDFNPATPRGEQILKHEFDHVAITTDPRIERLAPKVLWSAETWVESFPIDAPVTQELIGKKCGERLDERRKNFELLLSHFYRQLDTVSRDGTAAIDSRSAFFEKLYFEENLKELELAFLPKVKSLLSSKKFQETGNHYKLLDVGW